MNWKVFLRGIHRNWRYYPSICLAILRKPVPAGHEAAFGNSTAYVRCWWQVCSPDVTSDGREAATMLHHMHELGSYALSYHFCGPPAWDMIPAGQGIATAACHRVPHMGRPIACIFSYYAVCHFICRMKFTRDIANRPSPSSKKGGHFHIYSACGRSLCSSNRGFKYFRIGTFWQKFLYDTNHLSLSLIFHLYFRFYVRRKIQQNQKNSYVKNELRFGLLTTPTDIIRGVHLHQSCYEDIRIALDDFPASLCTILVYYFGAYVAKSPPYCDTNLFHVLESEFYSCRAIFNVGNICIDRRIAVILV